MTIRDFSDPPLERAPEPIKFKLDGDEFQAYPTVGGSVIFDAIHIEGLADFIDVDVTNLPPEKQIEAAKVLNQQAAKTMEFLDFVLMPGSREKFAERMRSMENPITLQKAMEIARWLVTQYGDRPTPPSSLSVNGADGTSLASMATAPSEMSTP